MHVDICCHSHWNSLLIYAHPNKIYTTFTVCIYLWACCICRRPPTLAQLVDVTLTTLCEWNYLCLSAHKILNPRGHTHIAETRTLKKQITKTWTWHGNVYQSQPQKYRTALELRNWVSICINWGVDMRRVAIVINPNLKAIDRQEYCSWVSPDFLSFNPIWLMSEEQCENRRQTRVYVQIRALRDVSRSRNWFWLFVLKMKSKTHNLYPPQKHVSPL